ncbi:ATP-binding protein [Streptomyces cyaneofuscatus]|uniref:ATP-binding protein n=1 Tax=Streptomyces cyaneofuscatus TaxID=66883 RepID=UPI00331C83BA
MEAPAKTQSNVTVRVFKRQFSSNPRGARLARRVGLHQLHTWGIPYLGDVSESAALIIGELTANAVTHGRVPGWDFELRLTHTPGDRAVALADSWAVIDREPPPGKTVRAELDLLY